MFCTRSAKNAVGSKAVTPNILVLRAGSVQQ